MIATILANVNRDRKKRSHPFKLADFMPKATGAPQRQTPEQQAAILGRAARRAG